VEEEGLDVPEFGLPAYPEDMAVPALYAIEGGRAERLVLHQQDRAYNFSRRSLEVPPAAGT
jgi:hypothetical protein